MKVYRIQPQNAKLHGIETITSNDEPAGGVHVFESLNEAYGCREWINEKDVEFTEIECDGGDLIPNGDFEGVTLLAGRGRIVTRRRFSDINAIAEWLETKI